MTKWMFQKFDAWAIRTGRKFAMVDMFGVVNLYRYYIFYVEKHVDTGWKAKYLPNLYIHHFTGNDFPGGKSQMEDVNESHYHPWGTFSLILTGGYTEEIDHGKDTKELYAPAVSLRWWDQSHRIIALLPDTWTLFFHGIRRASWSLAPVEHKVVCEHCVKYNNGVCANKGKESRIDFAPWMVLPNSSKEREGWKETVWLKCDDDFDKLITTRKRALERKGVKRPENKEQWNAIFLTDTINMRIDGKM
jgi:hypothetical protein